MTRSQPKGRNVHLDKQDLQKHFVCAKCHNRGCVAQEVAIASGTLSRMLPLASGRFIAVSCSLCGYTEFYNLARAVHGGDPAPSGKTGLSEEPENL